MLASNLTPETILLSAAYTEYHDRKLWVLLGGVRARAPALVLPGFGPDGRRSGFDVARLFPPFVFPNGREAKYLCPWGAEPRAYFPPMPCVRQALDTPGAPLMVTEGILKALAASQAGVPCIGLMGVWNWQLKREDKSDPRLLTPDLAGVDWRGRVVPIAFDADRERKPNNNYAAAELARVLAEDGADARVTYPPLGPVGPGRRPMKQAIDDFLVRLARDAGSREAGEAAFREWFRALLAEGPARDLDDYRREMVRARLEGRKTGNTLLDLGLTGVGKSYADFAAIRRMEDYAMGKWHSLAEYLAKRRSRPRSVLLVPTHAQAAEAVEAAGAQGLPMVAYPKLCADTCLRHDEAAAVQARGLAFQLALCPGCEFREECLYREQSRAADLARHAVATQARGAVTMPRLAARRNLITLHETPLDVIRPTVVAERGLLVVELVARQAEHAAADPNDRGFYRHLGRLAKELDGWLNGGEGPAEVPLPEPVDHEPENLHADLNEAVEALGAAPAAEAMQLALSAATGGLDLIGLGVDERPSGRDEVKTVRKLVGVVKTDLPAGCWLNDATADREELEAVLGRPLRDITPTGRLLRHHPVLQVVPARDVTKGRDPAAAASLLRGILYDLTHRRVGLLTHKKLAAALPKLLGEPYRDRLSMVAHFGSGLSRGSNQWTGGCDILIVMGTPRVPPDAIRLHLYRLGKSRAAGRTREGAGWGIDYWSGVTESGRRVTVRTPHYKDHDWHGAYRSLVRSELVQAVGRGRGILPEGIPVLVVTTENLSPTEDGRGGPRIADHPYAPLTDAQARALACLRRGGHRVVAQSSEVAGKLGVSERWARELLAELEAAGRVRRVGQRCGWLEIAHRNPVL
jgi:hypothetical protein